jgi:hypothetical protein
LAYKEKQIKILKAIERNAHTKTTKLCQVQWSHHTEEEATWEHRENLLGYHPYLFASLSKLEGELHLKGVSL